MARVSSFLCFQSPSAVNPFSPLWLPEEPFQRCSYLVSLFAYLFMVSLFHNYVNCMREETVLVLFTTYYPWPRPRTSKVLRRCLLAGWVNECKPDSVSLLGKPSDSFPFPLGWSHICWKLFVRPFVEGSVPPFSLLPTPPLCSNFPEPSSVFQTYHVFSPLCLPRTTVLASHFDWLSPSLEVNFSLNVTSSGKSSRPFSH